MHKDSKIESIEQSRGSSIASKMKLPLLLMSPLILAGCLGRTVEPEVVLQTEYVEKTIPVQERPAKVEMPPVDWFVITEENLDEKLAEVKEKTGQIVFIAITPKGYENLALGIGDLRRYIKQQQSIIAYYEEAVTPAESEPVEEEKE